ncbi:MAG: hypothetical protein OHK0029_03990 [Armatimonadaceae bacterium]
MAESFIYMQKRTLPDSAYEDVVNLLAEGGGPEAVLAFRFSELFQKRLIDLAKKKRIDAITDTEERELAALMEQNVIVGKAKERARQILQERRNNPVAE